jgi:hypothetical protein
MITAIPKSFSTQRDKGTKEEMFSFLHYCDHYCDVSGLRHNQQNLLLSFLIRFYLFFYENLNLIHQNGERKLKNHNFFYKPR